MSKAIKTYQQLPPNVKQAINNTAAKAARAVANQVKNEVTRKKASQSRNQTRRTRNGMRIYTPSDVVETRAFAPVSYATSWTSGNKSLRVHQTEIIGRISANSTWFPSWNPNYSVATFPINPANPTTFPWLSYIARLYDKYRFHSLKFIYINSVSTQVEGNIMMSLDYDTLDAAPNSVVEASQLARYKLTPLYYPADFPIPVNHPGNNPWLYTFDLSATQNNVDLKTYNLGNFFLAVDGVPQNGKDYGYLAVEYDVELLDKNPVDAASIFASATYDSAAPVAKKNRSNVDPADTMEVSVDWSTPATTTDELPCSLTFSDNVPIGSKARVGLWLAAMVEDPADDMVGIRLDTDENQAQNVTILTQEHPGVTRFLDNYCTVYADLDVTIPETRSVSVTVTPTGGATFKASGYYYKHIMAFTYA